MIVTVFRSRLRPGLQDEYVALVDRMQEIARTIPGYISHKGFWSDDGERVTIVEFEHRGRPDRLADASGASGGAKARAGRSITKCTTSRSRR